MKNLFTSEMFQFSEEAGVIVLRLHSKASRLTLDRIKACGFTLDKQRKFFCRKNNFDGQNAAGYLAKQLQEDM